MASAINRKESCLVIDPAMQRCSRSRLVKHAHVNDWPAMSRAAHSQVPANGPAEGEDPQSAGTRSSSSPAKQ